MEIRNIKTQLSKQINLESCSVYELNKIYEFYSEHKDFDIIIDGEVD